MSTTPPEYIVIGVTNSRGNLHGRDHLSLDGGATTLCGLADRQLSGGRSDLHALLFVDKACRSAMHWSICSQCTRCAKAAPQDMVNRTERLMREQDW